MIHSGRMTPPYRLVSVLRRYGRVLTAALICGVLIYVIAESLGFTEEARRAPLVVAVPTAIASLVLVVKELISPAKLEYDEPAQPPSTAARGGAANDVGDGGRASGRRERSTTTAISTAGAVTWVLVLTAIFLLLGLLLAIPLFTITFMRIYGRERWHTTLLTAAVVFGLVYVFFVQVLGVQVFDGWALSWLGVM